VLQTPAPAPPAGRRPAGPSPTVIEASHPISSEHAPARYTSVLIVKVSVAPSRVNRRLICAGELSWSGVAAHWLRSPKSPADHWPSPQLWASAQQFTLKPSPAGQGLKQIPQLVLPGAHQAQRTPAPASPQPQAEHQASASSGRTPDRETSGWDDRAGRLPGGREDSGRERRHGSKASASATNTIDTQRGGQPKRGTCAPFTSQPCMTGAPSPG